MAKVRVKLHSAGMREMLNSGPVADEMARRAQPVAAQARANAPVESGSYQASIHVEPDTTDRAVARVVADAPHAHRVEARTGNLARALDAAR